MSANYSKMIDHTILKPDASSEDIARLCSEAKKYGFASVCVNAKHVPLAASLLKGSPVKVCTVVGFPLGATFSKVKAFEASEAIRAGAGEIDMVIDIGAAKEHDWNRVREDIAEVLAAVPSPNILKVIIETCLLTDEEKKQVCIICRDIGVAFVKTSTGFSSGGATEADVALMRATVGEGLGVKASGGVRTKEDAAKMVAAGANRLGTSNGMAIVS